MSASATTTAPDHPSPLPSGELSWTDSGPETARWPRPALCRASVTSGGSSEGKQRRGSISGPSQQRQVTIKLELADLRLVLVPFGPLVADEPFEDVVAQCLGQQLGALHFVDGVMQAGGQRRNALGGQLAV